MPNNQQSIDQLLILGKTQSELQPCAANRSGEDLYRRYAHSQPASVLLSATQQVQRQLAPLLVRHVTGGLCPPTSTGRQRPSGLHSWPLTIRKEDHSVSGTTLFFHPTFKVQHPTSTIQPSALPLSPANRTYPAATKQCQDAICSLLPCNTGAILECFFGKTQRMEYCASHV